jgi:23S rRNA (guanosine2251-2'-O)-methyltransferase
MYNHLMQNSAYQIRLCNSCGLRYPLMDGHAFGTRCPICMGDTRLILSRELSYEPKPDRPDISYRAGAKKSLKKGKKENLRDRSESRGSNTLTVLLDNIRSAWNVGSILRSADGFGFAHAYLCGITPTPENEAVTKTALGAEDSVPWSYHKDAVKLVKGLKKEGWNIWVLEECDEATPISRVSIPKSNKQAVLIAGSEVTGVDPELLELADEIFYIPMRGEKKSFNVAMAFSIAAYALNN